MSASLMVNSGSSSRPRRHDRQRCRDQHENMATKTTGCCGPIFLPGSSLAASQGVAEVADFHALTQERHPRPPPVPRSQAVEISS